MRLLLVRHAESEGNALRMYQGRSDTDLSETGREQARRLHDRLNAEGLRPTHVLSSPLKRALETGQIVCRSWSVPIRTWDELVEHDYGVFSGLRWDEIEAVYPAMGREYNRTKNWDVVQGAETMRDRRVRGEGIVRRLLEGRDPSDVVLVFSHGGAIQSVVSALLGAPGTWGIPVHNTAVFDFFIDLEGETGTADALDNPRWRRIERFNDASHLELGP